MDYAQMFADYWWVLVLLIIFFGSFFTINQGYIGVITMFGKYRRIVRPGLNKKSFYTKPLGRAGISGSNIRPGECIF